MNIIVSYRKPLAAGIIIVAVLTTAAYAADEQTMTQPTVTSHTIAVEHIRIASGRPFAEVRQRLESAVPAIDTLARALRSQAKGYQSCAAATSLASMRSREAGASTTTAEATAVRRALGLPPVGPAEMAPRSVVSSPPGAYQRVLTARS